MSFKRNNRAKAVVIKKKALFFSAVIIFILSGIFWLTMTYIIYKINPYDAFSFPKTSENEESVFAQGEVFMPPIHDIIGGVATTQAIGITLLNPDNVVITTATPYVDTGEFFSGCAFIGNSRTQGLDIFTEMPGAVFYTSKGLTVSSIYTDPVVANKAGEQVSIMQALSEIHYDKIFIMLGVNELGWDSDEEFVIAYSNIVSEIKAMQPQATVYVQSILPVSQWKNDNHEYIKNQNIEVFNTLIRGMCAAQGAVYLDVAATLKDETGALFSAATTDGVHLTQEYCLIWENYLKNYPY